MSTARTRRWLVPCLIGIGIGMGFTLNSVGLMPTPHVSIRWTFPIKEAAEYVPPATQRSGDEIVLVYIGASTCRWSNVPDLPASVKHLKRRIFAEAQARGAAFASIGIARDEVAADGVKYLRRFGDFDELMSGRGWVNSGVQQYVFGDMPGRAMTPQIIVVWRTLEYKSGRVIVRRSRLVARKTGVEAIRSWDGALTSLPNIAAVP